MCLFHRLRLIAAVVVGVTATPAAAKCIDVSSLSGSTVVVSRAIEKQAFAASGDRVLMAGTGWFLSNQDLVTASHVADAMRLSNKDWSRVTLRERGREVTVDARIGRLVEARPERIAVLKLRRPVRLATPLRVRTAPLTENEQVRTIAYTGLRQRFAQGRFVREEKRAGLKGAALMELYDGTDRLVVDHGASGAPVVDCRGSVVAVIVGVLTQKVSVFAQAPIRISTAWRSPNVVAAAIPRIVP